MRWRTWSRRPDVTAGTSTCCVSRSTGRRASRFSAVHEPGATPIPDVLAPARLGPITLRNRILKSATLEGALAGALVTQDLIDFHTAVGRGGVGMTTVAYLAVSPEGRTERDQIY